MRFVATRLRLNLPDAPTSAAALAIPVIAPPSVAIHLASDEPTRPGGMSTGAAILLAFTADLGGDGIWWGMTVGLAAASVLLVTRVVRRL